MEKKIIIGGVVFVVIIGVIIIATSTVSPFKLDKSDDPSQIIQEGKEAKLTPEEMIREAQNQMLKKYVFYKGNVVINEQQSWKSRGTDGSSGKGEATLTSEDLIIFDEKTNKGYLVGRRLYYKSHHTVTANDLQGNYISTDVASASGELTEYYGTGFLRRAEVKDAQASTQITYELDFGLNPVRMDIGQKLIYTNPPTNKDGWVIFVSILGNERPGLPRIFPPETRIIETLSMVPNISTIEDTRTYNKDETYAYEYTGRFFVPVGRYASDFRKLTYDEAMEELEEIKDDIEWEEAYEEMAKNQPPAWKETAKYLGEINSIADATASHEDMVNYIVPEKSTQNEVRSVLNALYDNQHFFQENLDKIRSNIEKVQADQGTPRQLNNVVIETSNDQKGGTEQKNLKKNYDLFMPVLNSLLQELDSYLKALEKNMEEAKALAKMKDKLPEDKVTLLFKDIHKNTQSLKKINSCLRDMITEFMVILSDLNEVKNANDETRYGELNKLYRLWSQILNNYKTGQDVSVKVDVEKGVPLPAGYPLDVVKIIDKAIIAVAEIVKEEGATKNGFAVTLKTNLTIDEVLQFYKTNLKNVSDLNILTVGGITTLSGQKGGYEISIMIMKNHLSGTEKTMVQITLTPI